MRQIHPTAPPIPGHLKPPIDTESRVIAALRAAYRTGVKQPQPNAPDRRWKAELEKEVACRLGDKDRTAVIAQAVTTRKPRIRYTIGREAALPASEAERPE